VAFLPFKLPPIKNLPPIFLEEKLETRLYFSLIVWLSKSLKTNALKPKIKEFGCQKYSKSFVAAA
jgi:hypothetical protein